MRYFIVTDVHGFYDQMCAALDAAGYDLHNPNHCFVSLGDLYDRGPQPIECLDFVMNKVNPARRILVRGNHEDLMEDRILRGHNLSHDYHNGTAETYDVIKEADKFDLLLSYHSALCVYAETKTGIFVHGWIPCHTERKGFTTDYERYDFVEKWRDAPESAWESARWLNGVACWSDGVRVSDKTIYCGHWHCSWANYALGDASNEWEDFTPFEREGICALDACTAYSGIVNCVVMEE